MRADRVLYRKLEKIKVSPTLCISSKLMEGTIIQIENSKEVLVENNAANLERLRKAGYKLDPSLRKTFRTLFVPRTDIAPQALPRLSLRPYQQEGVDFMLAHRGKVLLADEMGLGKTPQVLTWIQTVQPTLTVIVCPAHLKYMWEDEYKKFFGTGRLECEVLAGRTNYPIPATKVIIVNYDILPYWVEYLIALGSTALIVDEAQNVKNLKAARSRAVELLSQVCKYKIMVTGTPVLNTLADIWTLVHYIEPSCLGGWTAFANKYTKPFTKKFWVRQFKQGRSQLKLIRHTDISRTKNTDQLRELLYKTVMLRRTKAEVLPQLPSKQRQYLWVDMALGAYNQARALWLKVCKHKGPASLEAAKQFSVVRRLLAESKVDDAEQWIKDAMAKTSRPLVVIGWHRSPLEKLHERFKRSVLLYGGVGPKDKKQIVVDFQAGKIPLLLANMQSGGTGLTLTAANTILFLELPLTDGLLSQAEDRIHRISQTGDHVYYIYLLVKDTLESRILELIEQKREISTDVLGAGKGTTESLMLGIYEKERDKKVIA